MDVIKKTHLITCYLDKDKAEELAAFLHQECRLNTAYFAHARGQCSSEKENRLWKERDILQVMVNKRQANTIFEKIYFYLQLDRQPNGFIFMEKLIYATEFNLPQ